MNTHTEYQPELFPADATPAPAVSSSKLQKPKKKKKPSRKPKGLQYKIQFWKGLKGERSRKFHSVTFESSGNTENWRDIDIDQLAVWLLERTLEEVLHSERKQSSKVAEIVAWIERRFDDESPFNFELCARLSGCDPDELREQVMARIEQAHGTTYPHYQVLRCGVIDAEAGDPDAARWVMSDTTGPLSFVDCCKALGFDPKKARQEIHLPVPMDNSAEIQPVVTTPIAIAA